jgi:hypothetical protein
MPAFSGTVRTRLTPYAVSGRQYGSFGGKSSGATGFGRIEYTIPRSQIEYTVKADRLEYTARNARLEFTGKIP